MRIFSSNPKAHKTTHGKAGDGPVLPVGKSAIMGIDIVNELGEIYWKLAKSFYRGNVVWTYIVAFFRTPVIPIRLNYNGIVIGYKICNIVTLVLISFVSTPLSLGSISKIPLGPAMEKINYRIFFLKIAEIPWRQKDSIVSHLSKYSAIMLRIQNCNITCILSTA